MEETPKFEGFNWDEHNSQKNWIKHAVSSSECEQVFFNIPLVVGEDEEHSKKEKRYYALGQTDEKKLLFIAYTIRHNLIRVISARPMDRRERMEYQNHEE